MNYYLISQKEKNKISISINDIIKESSVDCIKNTKDNIQLNNNCLRFLKEVKDEDSHYPGISSENLNQIDKKQFTPQFIKEISPNIYIISGNNKNKFIYYKLKNEDEDKKIDVRYIKENGKRLGDYHYDKNLFFYNENKENKLNDVLTNKFSLYQTVFETKDYSIIDDNFDTIETLTNNDNHIGYVIKDNINQNIFFSRLLNNEYLHFYEYNKWFDDGLNFELFMT